VKTIKLGPLAENVPVDEHFKGIGPYDVAEFELSVPERTSAAGPKNAPQVKLLRYLPNQPNYDVLDPFQEVAADKKIEWKRPNRRTVNEPNKQANTTTAQSKYYFKGDSIQFYLTNLLNEPVEVTAKLVTTVEYDETSIIPSSMLMFLGSVLLYYLIRGFFPRVIAIAATTMKEAIYQPLYIILIVCLIVFIYLQIFIPQNTFGEDIKPFKENTLTLIMVAGSFIAIWTASHSIADEIEGRTALTVLSKPVGRIEFILGKYLGVLFPVVLLFLLCGGFFTAMIPFKVVYDAGESSKQVLSWQEGFQEMRLILPALGLSFMQTMILAAISVAISTRLPMLANLLITISIYLVGNLLPLLVQSKKVADPYEIIQNLARFFATIFPVFEHFGLHTAITAGKEIPWDYMGWLMIYTLTYCTLALLVSLVLFEDRDLS
jgi:ABC-type transport system involved in multi-copper enzyme maturation permease subunit